MKRAVVKFCSKNRDNKRESEPSGWMFKNAIIVEWTLSVFMFFVLYHDKYAKWGKYYITQWPTIFATVQLALIVTLEQLSVCPLENEFKMLTIFKQSLYNCMKLIELDYLGQISFLFWTVTGQTSGRTDNLIAFSNGPFLQNLNKQIT